MYRLPSYRVVEVPEQLEAEPEVLRDEKKGRDQLKQR